MWLSDHLIHILECFVLSLSIFKVIVSAEGLLVCFMLWFTSFCCHCIFLLRKSVDLKSLKCLLTYILLLSKVSFNLCPKTFKPWGHHQQVYFDLGFSSKNDKGVLLTSLL